MTSSSTRAEILHCVQNDRVKGPSHDQCCLDFFPPGNSHTERSDAPFYTTLGTEGRRPDGCHTPLFAEGAGPYGNTAAPPTGIYCHWQYLLSVPRSFADAQDDSGRRSPDPRSRSSIPAAPRLHAHHNSHARRRVKLSPSPFGTPYHLSPASSGTIKIRADNPHGPSGRVQCTKKEPQFPAALSALIH